MSIDTDLPDLNVEDCEAELVRIEKEIDFRLDNIPREPGETNDLYYWAKRFSRLMDQWRQAYTNVVLAEALQEDRE